MVRHHWVDSYCCYKFIHVETRRERVHIGKREIFLFFIHREQKTSFHGKSLKENNNGKTLWFLFLKKEEGLLLLFLHNEKPSIKVFPSCFGYMDKTKREKPWKNTNKHKSHFSLYFSFFDWWKTTEMFAYALFIYLHMLSIILKFVYVCMDGWYDTPEHYHMLGCLHGYVMLRVRVNITCMFACGVCVYTIIRSYLTRVFWWSEWANHI